MQTKFSWTAVWNDPQWMHSLFMMMTTMTMMAIAVVSRSKHNTLWERNQKLLLMHLAKLGLTTHKPTFSHTLHDYGKCWWKQLMIEKVCCWSLCKGFIMIIIFKDMMIKVNVYRWAAWKPGKIWIVKLLTISSANISGWLVVKHWCFWWHCPCWWYLVICLFVFDIYYYGGSDVF